MILDLIVLGILFVSAAVAFMRGFVREILTIGSLAGAAAATLAFGSALTPAVRDWLIDPKATEPQVLFGLVPYEMLAPVVAYGLVFVGTLVVLTIVTHMVSKGVHAVGLGPVDRSLGVAFGLVRGIIIVGLMSLVVNFVLNDEQRTQFFGQSKTYPYISYMGDLTQALMPGREVLNKVKKHGDGDNASVGQQPLEPGQSGVKKSGADGYTAGQRKQIEGLIEQPNRPTRALPYNN